MNEIEFALHKYKTLQATHFELFNNSNAPLKILTEESAILAWQSLKKMELDMNLLPESWSNIGILLEDPHILVLRDLVEFPNNQVKGYIRLLNIADLNNGQGSAILPVKNGHILLLHHYRHPTRKWHWEIPRGFGTPQMSAEDNAKQEIREEIGGEIDEIIDLGEYHNNTGIEGFSVRLFFANLSKVSHVQTEEGIDFFDLFSVSEVEKMIEDGKITDGFTIAAYTRAKLGGLLEKAVIQNEWKISKDVLFPDVLHIQPPIFHDNRGYFMETFDLTVFRRIGIPVQFMLDHESSSRKRTLRGLHYQIKYSQGKLVRVSHGEIFTVVVDMRRNSQTFGKWTHVNISSENKKILWIPKGFAHGFYVLSESATVTYKTTDIYAPEWEQVLDWNDSTIGIEWPIRDGEHPILSEKDNNGKSFENSEYYELNN